MKTVNKIYLGYFVSFLTLPVAFAYLGIKAGHWLAQLAIGATYSAKDHVSAGTIGLFFGVIAGFCFAFATGSLIADNVPASNKTEEDAN